MIGRIGNISGIQKETILIWTGGERMKLADGGRLVIESRYEIDDIQKMIDLLIQSGDNTHMTREELERLRDQLDVLYMSW